MAHLFLFLFDKQILQLIAYESNKYTFEDWVTEAEATDADGQVKKRKMLKLVCDVICPNKWKRVLE